MANKKKSKGSSSRSSTKSNGRSLNGRSLIGQTEDMLRGVPNQIEEMLAKPYVGLGLAFGAGLLLAGGLTTPMGRKLIAKVWALKDEFPLNKLTPQDKNLGSEHSSINQKRDYSQSLS